jgi:hypothetical protein
MAVGVDDCLVVGFGFGGGQRQCDDMTPGEMDGAARRQRRNRPGIMPQRDRRSATAAVAGSRLWLTVV